MDFLSSFLDVCIRCFARRTDGSHYGQALVLLVDENGAPRVNFIPPSTISLAAAVVGVFGFEFLFRKFVIGFGENKFDLDTTLQNLVDQAVAATLKKETGGP